MQTLRKKSLEQLAKAPKIVAKGSLSSNEFSSHVLNSKQLQKFISQKAFDQILPEASQKPDLVHYQVQDHW